MSRYHVDKNYDVVTDRMIDRMKQVENDVEKDKVVAQTIIDKTIETTESFIDVVTDHFAERLSGEKFDMEKAKNK